MRTLFGIALAVTVVGTAPAHAGECPTLHAQIVAQTGNRFDAASHAAKALAAEGDTLHRGGKHAEAVAKYEEAAKAIGVPLTRAK